MDNFSLAAKSFIVKDNKLLIIKRSSNSIQKPNIWELPGGRLEPGEPPIDGLKRETKEETGLEIEIIHPISVRHFKRDDGQKITTLIFLCKALSDEIKISHEHSDFEWIDLKNCKEKLAEFFHSEVDTFHKLELFKHL